MHRILSRGERAFARLTKPLLASLSEAGKALGLTRPGFASFSLLALRASWPLASASITLYADFKPLRGAFSFLLLAITFSREGGLGIWRRLAAGGKNRGRLNQAAVSL